MGWTTGVLFSAGAEIFISSPQHPGRLWFPPIERVQGLFPGVNAAGAGN